MSNRILIADDSTFMRGILRNSLKHYGYTVVGEATNGVEAVKLYKFLKPKIVMMDIAMPEMCGIEALKQIIAIDPAAMVLMVSALGEKKLVNESFKNGAKDFIIKPFTKERVHQAITKVTEKEFSSSLQAPSTTVSRSRMAFSPLKY